MVGLVLDGRECGPGARSLAEDLAHGLASDGIQTHQIELVPTPASSPRLLHSIRQTDRWLRRDDPPAPVAAQAHRAGDPEQSERCLDLLAAQAAHLVERECIASLHALGLGLSSSLAWRLHQRCGIPYCITPLAEDLSAAESSASIVSDPRPGVPFASEEGESTRPAVLQAARHVVFFDDELRRQFETAWTRAGVDMPVRVRTLRRGVDLARFKPVPRAERARAAAALQDPVAAHLAGIDWEHACVVLCLQPAEMHAGFEPFLFALPQVLMHQPALQVIVVRAGDEAAESDRLLAPLAAGRIDIVHEMLQSSELYQPLLDHLELLQHEGRSQRWWDAAARLEPERRVRCAGRLARDEFARLLPLADVFVVADMSSRRPSQALVEALACGVLPLAAESAGIAPLARLIAEEISAEIASLCVLRAEAPAVREMEEKLGRVVRLRPDVSDRLRTLAVRKFDARRTAFDVRRLHGEPARIAALRV